jgi:hypothetical protein
MKEGANADKEDLAAKNAKIAKKNIGSLRVLRVLRDKYKSRGAIYRARQERNEGKKSSDR